MSNLTLKNDRTTIGFFFGESSPMTFFDETFGTMMKPNDFFQKAGSNVGWTRLLVMNDFCTLRIL